MHKLPIELTTVSHRGVGFGGEKKLHPQRPHNLYTIEVSRLYWLLDNDDNKSNQNKF